MTVPESTPRDDTEITRERCTCGEPACESTLCGCDTIPCPVNHRAEEAEAEVERLRAELTEAKGAQEARQAHTGHVMRLLEETRKLVEETEDERDAFKRAVEQIRRMAQVWVDIRPTHPTATQDGHTMAYAGEQILAALGAPGGGQPCPRCEGSMFEPGTEEEEWVPGAIVPLPPSGEPCTACNGSGTAAGGQ